MEAGAGEAGDSLLIGVGCDGPLSWSKPTADVFVRFVLKKDIFLRLVQVACPLLTLVPLKPVRCKRSPTLVRNTFPQNHGCSSEGADAFRKLHPRLGAVETTRK